MHVHYVFEGRMFLLKKYTKSFRPEAYSFRFPDLHIFPPRSLYIYMHYGVLVYSQFIQKRQINCVIISRISKLALILITANVERDRHNLSILRFEFKVITINIQQAAKVSPRSKFQ